MPALFDTTVKSPRSGLSLNALISVLGTPENPNPPTRSVAPLETLSIALLADGQSLLILCRALDTANPRLLPPTRFFLGNRSNFARVILVW